MNIENLKEGLVVKNYKEMCELLEITPSAGNTKKAQFRELDQYCSYHKDGQKIIIDKIFDEIQEKEDLRKYNGGDHNNIEYIKYIEALVLNLLAEKEIGILFLSKYSILRELKMINDNYSFCKGRIEKLEIHTNISKDNIYEFYESTDNTLIKNLEKALNNLSDKSLISWNKEISVCECVENSFSQIEDEINTDEYDKQYHTYKSRLNLNYRQATNEEIQKILFYENETINKLGRKNKQDIVKHKEWKQFRDIVCNNLLNHGIVFYYNSYKIIFNHEHICNELSDICSFLLSSKEKSMNEDILNKQIVDRLKNNAKKRQDRAKEYTKNTIGIIQDENLKRRVKDTYLSDECTLIDILISQETKNIKSKIRKTKIPKNEHN